MESTCAPAPEPLQPKGSRLKGNASIAIASRGLWHSVRSYAALPHCANQLDHCTERMLAWMVLVHVLQHAKQREWLITNNRCPIICPHSRHECQQLILVCNCLSFVRVRMCVCLASFSRTTVMACCPCLPGPSYQLTWVFQNASHLVIYLAVYSVSHSTAIEHDVQVPQA